MGANNEASRLLNMLGSSEALENVVTNDKPGDPLAKKGSDFKASLVEQEPSLEGQRFSGMSAEKTKSTKDLGPLDDKPSKKARLDNSAKFFKESHPDISSSALDEDMNGRSVQKKLKIDSDYAKASGNTGGASDDKTKSKLVKDSLGQDMASSKMVELDEKTAKISNGTLHKVAALHTSENCQVLEVTRKPEADRSKWFKGLPWEERMQTAHEQGTLVLLENLDPSFTSAEIEDIIWHGFRENCTAKIVQRTATSSPHSGRALVIFKTKEAVEMAITKLSEGCLMLPNGRPLVGSRATLPSLSGKSSTLVGHLFIDKIKLQMQREKKATSTSHCSQPNTIEYDMAMEWRLLQARSDYCWKKLYKGHGEELRKLRSNLKSK